MEIELERLKKKAKARWATVGTDYGIYELNTFATGFAASCHRRLSEIGRFPL